MKILKRFMIALLLALTLVLAVQYFLEGYGFVETTFFTLAIISLAMLMERLMSREEKYRR